MSALRSPWFWLALLALALGAFWLTRRPSTKAAAVPLPPKSPPSSGGTLHDIATLATVASSIFDKVYSNKDDDED